MPGAASIPNFEYYITLFGVVKPDSSRIPENNILSFYLIMNRHMYYENGVARYLGQGDVASPRERICRIA